MGMTGIISTGGKVSGNLSSGAKTAAAEVDTETRYIQGPPGKDGYTPVKGVDYFDGKDGKDGYTPQKGIDYVDGKDGYTPQKNIDYFDGKDGYTPIKGVDYYTNAERAEMVEDVMNSTNVKPYAEEAKAAASAAANSKAAAASSASAAAASESASKAAQAAAEKARDEAQQAAGGDFATPAYVDNKFEEAKAYTDEAVKDAGKVQSVNGMTGDVTIPDFVAGGSVLAGLSGVAKTAWSAMGYGKYGTNSTYQTGVVNTNLNSGTDHWNVSNATLDMTVRFEEGVKTAPTQIAMNLGTGYGVPTVEILYMGDDGALVSQGMLEGVTANNAVKYYDINADGIAANLWVVRLKPTNKWINLRAFGMSATVTGLMSGMAYDKMLTEVDKRIAAAKPTVPTKTSELTNDSGFITGYTETDPTVPAWAKAAAKPSYTADEVGAIAPETTTDTWVGFGDVEGANIQLLRDRVAINGQDGEGFFITTDYNDTGAGYVDGVPIATFVGGVGDEPVILRNIESPVQDNDAANKQYVDNAVANAGGGGNISFAEEIPAPSDMEDGEVRFVGMGDGDIELLEYIEGTGKQYFVTDFYPNQDSRLVAEVQLTDTATRHLFGARTTSTTEEFFIPCINATTIRLDYGTQQNSVTVPSVLDRMVIDLNKDSPSVGGVATSFTAATFSTDYPLAVFTNNSAGSISADSYKAKMKLWKLQLYSKGVLAREYVAAQQNGVAGMYEKLTGRFIGSASSTAFTAGPATGEYISKGEAYFKTGNSLFKVGGDTDNAAAFGTRGPVIIQTTQTLDLSQYGLKVGDKVNVICIGGGGGGGGCSTTATGGNGGAGGKAIDTTTERSYGGGGGGGGGSFGAGGGGAGSDYSTSKYYYSAGGGGGGYIKTGTITLTSTSVAITIGAAGKGATSAAAGGTGGTTSFGSYLSAAGGGGGGAGGTSAAGAGGVGGTNGGSGAKSFTGSTIVYASAAGGGGGGGGWTIESIADYTGTSGANGAAGTSGKGGDGGDGGTSGGAGGAGGAYNSSPAANGGAGGNGAGAVIFWY